MIKPWFIHFYLIKKHWLNKLITIFSNALSEFDWTFGVRLLAIYLVWNERHFAVDIIKSNEWEESEYAVRLPFRVQRPYLIGTATQSQLGQGAKFDGQLAQPGYLDHLGGAEIDIMDLFRIENTLEYH